jgi:Domain of unknown function (DUF4397)
MRRILQLMVLGLAAGVGFACTPETVVQTEDIPTAGIRFVNAVPDTFAMDFRPVDIVENSTFYGVSFRSTSLLFYKAARAGSRHFRIFLVPPSVTSLTSAEQIAIASTVVEGVTVDLVEGHRYTFILWGYSRTGSSPAMKLDMIDDDPADPGQQVALRVINACLPGICGGSATGNLDVSGYLTANGVPATPTWAGLAPLSISTYQVSDTGTVKFNVKPAGGGANIFTDPTALGGQLAFGPGGITCPPETSGCDIDAIPGTHVPGSAVTLFIWPRKVGGSPTTPGSFSVWDRRPPRPPGT